MNRYIIETPNGFLFYVSFNPALFQTREGQPQRLAAFHTREEAESQIKEWTETT